MAKEITITLFEDESCGMEKLNVNGEDLFEGNLWDNHLEDAVEVLEEVFKKLDIKAKFKREDYEYE